MQLGDGVADPGVPNAPKKHTESPNKLVIREAFGHENCLRRIPLEGMLQNKKNGAYKKNNLAETQSYGKPEANIPKFAHFYFRQ